ncbi:hypothetical protein E8E11_008964 [Didymella keratinophila]|nr:hypothetical protein E8E11_008964 [Didymella keratinophila]
MLAFALELDRASTDRALLCRGRDSLMLGPFRALDLRYLTANIRTLQVRVTNKTWSIEDDITSRATIVRDEVIRPAEALAFNGWFIWYIMDMLCTYSETLCIDGEMIGTSSLPKETKEPLEQAWEAKVIDLGQINRELVPNKIPMPVMTIGSPEFFGYLVKPEMDMAAEPG